MILLCTLLFSGCVVLDKTSSLLNFVKTYGQENLNEKPDWTLVKSEHVGDGLVKILAYKNSANAAAKVAAQHKNNFRSTALLFPDQKNFIVARAVFGSKSATIILNDIDGVRGQEYSLNSSIEGNKFIIKSLVNNKTGEMVHYKKTATPTSNP